MGKLNFAPAWIPVLLLALTLGGCSGPDLDRITDRVVDRVADRVADELANQVNGQIDALSDGTPVPRATGAEDSNAAVEGLKAQLTKAMGDAMAQSGTPGTPSPAGGASPSSASTTTPGPVGGMGPDPAAAWRLEGKIEVTDEFGAQTYSYSTAFSVGADGRILSGEGTNSLNHEGQCFTATSSGVTKAVGYLDTAENVFWFDPSVFAVGESDVSIVRDDVLSGKCNPIAGVQEMASMLISPLSILSAVDDPNVVVGKGIKVPAVDGGSTEVTLKNGAWTNTVRKAQ